MKTIKISLFSLSVILFLQSCNNSTQPNDPLLVPDSLKTDSTIATTQQNPNLYAEVDSLFLMNGRKFTVNVKQYDLTELALNKGDTLTRPTFVCALRIFDTNKKLVFKDSLDVTSWGYPGKIKKIEAYQIAFPMLSNSADEIIASFNVFETVSEDVIAGKIGFNVNSNKTRYFWEEATLGE